MPARRSPKKPARATPGARKRIAAPAARATPPKPGSRGSRATREAARPAQAKKSVVRTPRAAAPARPAAVPEPASKPIVRARGLSGPKLEPYMKRLMDERRRLRQELSEMEQHQIKTEEKPVADVSGSYDDDLVDVATETFEREKGLALESSVQGMLQMVEDALRRGRSGTYGVCDGCGRQIDPSRLRVIPYARLCIKCKEREERLRSVMR
ncbi:MAG TPA: TraR/DksA C4-type zinc finger protein [bacterium]|nr:TraR/DksA C4-type zinc finger protein [bacterium]